MAKKDKLFKSKERKNREEVGEFLSQLSDIISGGKLVLRQGKEKITIEIPENLILEVEATQQDTKRKGKKHQLEIEIEWYDNDKYGGRLELG